MESSCASSRSVLWLIGGTSEAIVLAQGLAEAGIPTLVTVTTAAAQRAYPESPCLEVMVGALPLDHLNVFIQEHRVNAILDASHPFAVAISQGAIAVASQLQIPYWRYERPALDQAILANSALIQRVSSLEQVLAVPTLAGQRVLLTLGYRWLQAFQPWQTRTTLFARILPSAVALEAALAAGFTPDRLIALRPPISESLELALWQQWQITTVITKASGQPGGEATKQAVAQRLGTRLILVERPRVDYPALSHDLSDVLNGCCQWWQAAHSTTNSEFIR
ncbi:MAG: cobalt-precorrin-6A reductase [Leptolyngbyaceae cyanobacterium SM2_5_2]|nr:cobalt-precorrin-6A reductase [Leptolyngbyaceae cyanobacterium SM2_5_2]